MVGSIDSFREDSFMGQSSFGFAVERAMPVVRHVKSVLYPGGCGFNAQMRETILVV
ncbi:hypothetical protein OHAE_4395 [Ochrobactrum soli]|uniref:Uncharacterized protein n=1 Tax=Ochrobactrum soli TaxID=2448455 RepID=A0A2P9HBX9_9HYPH|nr:hypothetical protein OHAE_4395 [[Ochrobactrum] soli]